jgi:hypothetical protein
MNVSDIINSLNVISETLFKSVEGQIYIILDKIVNISPEILKSEPLKSILVDNEFNGIIVIANSMLLFYITYYIFTQLLSIYNGYKTENVYFFIIKIVLIGIVLNNSYFIIELILDILDIFTSSIESYCKFLINQDITFVNLKEKILSIKNFMNNDFLSLDGLIKGIISFGTITILINFSIRYVTIILFIIIFPLVLITITSSISAGIFKSYFKLLFINLFTQVIIKLIIFIPLMYKDIDSIMFKIILVGTIYLIYRLNTFINELFIKIKDEELTKNIFTKG